ncbi:MAG: cytochrome C [Pusillimonas sp.]|jgi:cytochrome c|nr:cytochrome C [Pusillimonas sp.]
MSTTTKYARSGRAIVIATAVALTLGLGLGLNAWADDHGNDKRYHFGEAASAEDLKPFFSPLPDGRGLPKGSGTVMQGEKVYQQQCLACHGANLEGGIGDRLAGGRGTLVNNNPEKAPVKTVESYWPYATTLFDYVKRAMPFDRPNSMSDDDVYAVSAYILWKGNIIDKDTTLNQDNLAKVEMPNKDGFKPANR